MYMYTYTCGYMCTYIIICTRTCVFVDIPKLFHRDYSFEIYGKYPEKTVILHYVVLRVILCSVITNANVQL